MPRLCFITGTDTGVGKTILTVLLTRHLRDAGMRVRAVKPFCSGGRADARVLFQVQAGEVPLEEINHWHFPAPLAPLAAARLEHRRVSLVETLRFLRHAARQTDVLLIEGAGGLLSPLGEGFSARELIVTLNAEPLVVCPDRLGAINQALLVVTALPPSSARRARVLLAGAGRSGAVSASNLALLTERLGTDRVFRLPRLTTRELANLARCPVPKRIRPVIESVFPARVPG